MVPPTIAPVCLEPPLLELVSGAEGSAEDVLVDEGELPVEAASSVAVGDGMLSVVREDDDADDEAPSVVPVVVVPEAELEEDAVELEPCVKLTLMLVSCTSEEMPVALSDTVVARSLAVPQPHCENPPSNMFL